MFRGRTIRTSNTFIRRNLPIKKTSVPCSCLQARFKVCSCT
jgi:hypothetical protein